MQAKRNEIQTSLIESEIVSLRTKGLTCARIAEMLREQGITLSASEVAQKSSQIADKTRARTKSIVDEAFMLHGAREETLWRLMVQPHLDSIQAMLERGVTPPFDRDLCMGAIKIMERQAKRLGLDAKPAEKSNDWLQEKPDEELKELAKAYNIDLSVLELTDGTSPRLTESL